MKDFTHKIYKKLLITLRESNFQFLTIDEFYNSKYNKSKPLILIRHDVDRRPNSSLQMAKIENSMGIKATYYFRTIPSTFKLEIIKEIADLGHEIGYHYESLAETNGDYKEAIKDFENNLNRLREIYPIKTIAMHGRPTSKWDSRLLWDEYDYKKYSIVIEPYFDINFKEILYITDAGRAWDNEKVNLRDKVDSGFDFLFTHTEDIITLLKEKKNPNMIMVNIHPEHWSDGGFEWYRVLIIRKVKNFIKKILIT
jgi:hypothetical protein